VTKGFLDIQNDFGFTPKQAAQEKAYLYNEQLMNNLSNLTPEKIEQYKKKFEKCTLCVNLLNEFEDFVTEERWNEQFNMSLNMWLEMEASTNMRIFMNMPKAADLLVKKSFQRKRKIKPEDVGGEDEEMNQL
jgi:hypothetical protein